jgi:hypothetical protein
MEHTTHYGQIDFNLPHDVVPLPSKGIFYKNKKQSLKIGYLTAQDENILLSTTIRSQGVVKTLLKNKIYEPDMLVDELLECDIQAILIFLRNTSFGSDYIFKLKDPQTGREFEKTILLEELNIIPPKYQPNPEGLFEFITPRAGHKVLMRLMNMSDLETLDKLSEGYPEGMTVPIVTKRLEMQIVEMDGSRDKEKISMQIQNMPIVDSKYLRTEIQLCEPKLDLKRIVTAPSGEKVDVNIAFGAEFFRPFF